MPTIKQKKVAEKIVENHGSVSQAMIDVGYTPATAKNPKNLTDSKGWNELMRQYLSDDLLAKRHTELLNKRNQTLVRRRDEKGKEIFELVDQPDTFAVSKGLDMAYKLKGVYAAERSINVNINADTKVNPRAKELADEFEEKLRQTLLNE